MQGIIIAIINIIGATTVTNGVVEESLMITEDSLFFIVSEAGDNLIIQ